MATVSSSIESNGGLSPRYSVCIPAYNDVVALSRALESVRSQDCRGALECIISDDSTDDRIAEYVAGIRDIHVRYVRNDPPLGVPGNWNAALSLARGEIVTLLHQDDFYCQPNLLRIVARRMRQDKAQVAVCARSVWKSGECRQVYAGNGYHVRSFLVHYPQRTLVVNRVGHPSVVFVHNSLLPVPFDSDLTYFLDTRWYAQLWRRAETVVYVPEAEVGMELGRAGQLSESCLRDLEVVLEELELALVKSHATCTQRTLAFARLFASHARHWKHGGARAFGRAWQRLSPAHRILFCVAETVFLGHMGYRLLRRAVGLGAWG